MFDYDRFSKDDFIGRVEVDGELVLAKVRTLDLWTSDDHITHPLVDVDGIAQDAACTLGFRSVVKDVTVWRVRIGRLHHYLDRK